MRTILAWQQHRLDEAARVPFRPDLVLYRGGRPVSVADAKYAYVTPTAPPTSHLYQLLAYCTALGLPHGHLIYAAATPAAGADPAPHVVRRSGITVTAHTLDLAAPPATLLADVTTLAERIAGEGIAGEHLTPGRTATATAPAPD